MRVCEIFQEAQQSFNHQHIRCFISKELLFSVAVFEHQLGVKVAQKVPQYFFALSPIQDELQLFLRGGSSHRFEELLPCTFVDRVAIHNHSIKIEDGSSEHEISTLILESERAPARLLERRDRFQAFQYQSENRRSYTLPFGRQYEAGRETPGRQDSSRELHLKSPVWLASIRKRLDSLGELRAFR